MPGARRTRGLVCNLRTETRTRAYRYSRNTPAFPCARERMGVKSEDKGQRPRSCCVPHLCRDPMLIWMRKKHGDILTPRGRCEERSLPAAGHTSDTSARHFWHRVQCCWSAAGDPKSSRIWFLRARSITG